MPPWASATCFTIASPSPEPGRPRAAEAPVRGLRGMLLGPRELDQLRDQRRHLSELLDHVAQQPFPLYRRQRALAREDLDVGPQAGERRPQLVRGVGDELALCAARLL